MAGRTRTGWPVGSPPGALGNSFTQGAPLGRNMKVPGAGRSWHKGTGTAAVSGAGAAVAVSEGVAAGSGAAAAAENEASRAILMV